MSEKARHFAKLDPDTGEVIQLSTFRTKRVAAQPNSIEVSPAQFNHMQKNAANAFFYQNGNFTDKPREIPYDRQRFMAYPGVREQLDAIWKTMGPSLDPESPAGRMYKQVLKVKQDFPKPDKHAIGDEGRVMRSDN